MFVVESYKTKTSSELYIAVIKTLHTVPRGILTSDTGLAEIIIKCACKAFNHYLKGSFSKTTVSLRTVQTSLARAYAELNTT